MRIRSDYDVVIIGGGPAGLAAAIALRRDPELSVLVIESRTLDTERVGENCPPDVLILLAALGLQERFKESGHEVCPGFASMWGSDRVGYNDFIVNPYGPSWRLDRRAFDSMLAQRASELGADILWSTQFVKVAPKDGADPGWALKLASTQEHGNIAIQAGFVIDASGPKARFARALGVHKEIADQLFATIRFASVAHGHETISDRIHLEAVPEGWWYSVKLPHQRLVTMFVTEEEGVRRTRENQNEGFEEALGRTRFVGPALESLVLDDKSYQSRSIPCGILPKFGGDGWLAIGDAASSFDPVAAQGIYKALADGLRAGAMVLKQFDGTPIDLEDYSARSAQRYQAYSQNRDHVYHLEQRWPQAPFWRGRWEKGA